MFKKKKVTGTAMGIPAGLGVGLLTSIVITIAGAALIALLITSEKTGQGSMGYLSMFVLAAAAATGAIISAHLTKRLRLQVCMLSGVAYYLSLIATTALLFGGQYDGLGATGLVILAGCAIAAFLPMKKSGAGKKRKSAYR